jgi:superfamily I DNA and/or RNA helicase
LRRLNVAITRAKRKLIIIGNKNTLKANPTYCRLIRFVEDENLPVKI